jgi:hypothetical protein
VDLRRWTPAVPRPWLLLVAGLMWTTVGGMLCVLAYGWLSGLSRESAWPLGIVGIVAAAAIDRFGFSRLALRNVGRIAALPKRVCVFAFQAPKSYLLVLFMMGLGIALRGSPFPKSSLAVLYTGIGGGLFLSSLHYYRRLLALAGLG